MKANKQIIRNKILEQLSLHNKTTLKIKSDNIVQKLKNITKNYDTIFCYVSSQYEVHTLDFINYLLNQWKTILVPKIVWDDMNTVEIKKIEELKKWKFWILEPEEKNNFDWNIDLAIVPWLAFTESWKRIGKWWWFYDKFFSKYSEIYKIWICFDFQILEDFDTESHDILMDQIIYK